MSRCAACVLAYLLLPFALAAQHPGANWVYDPAIRTPQLFRLDDQLAYPALFLDQPEAYLTLAFDRVGTDRESPRNLDYSYQLVHCNADWRPSGLLPVEFFTGFANERIAQGRPSQQANVPYLHYTAQVPAAGTGGTFKRSGNYLLVVHPTDSPADTALTLRFVVAERAVQVLPQVGLSQRLDERFRLQQVAFALVPARIQLQDPSRELQVVVLQNFRWDNARSGLRPTFQAPGRLEYVFDAANDFAGGNEYRTADLRSLVARGATVTAVDCDPTCTVTLATERPRGSNTYLSNPDLNGQYYIGGTTADRRVGLYEPDYVQVRFRLALPRALPPGADVYLFGAMTLWACLPEFKLRYNDAEGVYEGLPLLKQGLYDYQYVVFLPGDAPDETQLEGSHFETENAYAILVYFRRFGDRADRLAGMQFVGYYPEGR